MPLHSADSDHSVTAQKPPTNAAWRVELLGRLRAFPIGDAPEKNGDAGSPTEAVEVFRTHKVALLLARFALFPDRAHARDELVEWLWPDAPADRGRASLTQALVHLRAALHQPRTGGVFIADHKTVRVAKNALQTDVADWEAAACRVLNAASAVDDLPIEQADCIKAVLAAYTGSLLPGFYDEWVEAERNRLGELRSDLQVRLQTAQAERKARAALSQKAAQETTDAENVAPFLHNTPLFLTRFFGRETERQILRGLLAESPPVRLVTLLGMGGIGKTRLAVEMAQEVLRGNEDASADWVWAAFVPQDTARTANQMESVLLAALGVQSKTADGISDAAKYLDARGRTPRSGRILLVLDNLEQLDEACIPVVARLLTLVPCLMVLATSRQPVGITGEREILLGPLSGEAKAASSADEANRLSEAVRLFIDRACLARPGFTLTADNRDAVFTLCALLEGVPLALELGAAWMRVLTPAQIAARLKNRFDVLQRCGAFVKAGTSQRHQSLHAAIAWSYDLLPPNLQTFWAQLSVFRGGWTAEAARAVTGVNDVAESLLLLAERSLILVDEDEVSGTARYRMLESLREFTHEQWGAQKPSIKNAARLRHARYFADLSYQSDTMPQTKQAGRPGLALLGPERDNLRVIFIGLQEITRQSESDASSFFAPFVQATVEIIGQSIWFWPGKEIDSYLEWAGEAIRHLPDETASRALRARVLALQGRRASLTGDYATATHLLNESIALWQALNNAKEAVLVRNFCAAQAWVTGNSAEAFVILSESLRFAQETGDLRMESAMLHNVAMVGPDLEQRRRWIERAVSLNRDHWPGSTFHAASLSCMGVIAYEQADWKTAQACLEEANEIAADGGRGTLAVTKEGLAEFFYKTNTSLDRAEDLLREAQVLYEELEEWPRIANVLLTRFHVALKRSDFSSAPCYAQHYLTVNRDARLMDEAQLCAAQADLTKQLRDAGYAAPLSFGAPLK